MYVLAIDPGIPPGLADSLLEEMRERGQAAVVESDRSQPNSSDVIRAHYDGTGWELAVPDEDLSLLLDELAARADYAVLDGITLDAWPALEIDDGTVDGEILVEPAAPDEVAVSAAIDRLESTEPWESLESLVAAVKQSSESDRAGAIATFTGRVRARDEPDDIPTTRLEFEAYGDVAWKRMNGIADEIRARDGVFDVRMHHRTGVIEDGEDIVFVVILAGHRDEAFQAVEDGINRLKAEVPIFKKEVTVDEEFWVHTRP